ncbi:hypothetical protein QAD02_023011 [Eretmocerus hayati]|uniref:Uncharacterized protein n=1 Tax=Eretmocerus hayati TaxID=131215 RepID=A0ACC2PUU8_9HYME|nr:hypothetical protein QAD02_023011 [Eretmocerus hayati]
MFEFHEKLKKRRSPSLTGIRENEEVKLVAQTATSANEQDIFQIPLTNVFKSFKYKARLDTSDELNIKRLTAGERFFECFNRDKIEPWFSNRELINQSTDTYNR